jgi:hypothetical protein
MSTNRRRPAPSKRRRRPALAALGAATLVALLVAAAGKCRARDLNHNFNLNHNHRLQQQPPLTFVPVQQAQAQMQPQQAQQFQMGPSMLHEQQQQQQQQRAVCKIGGAPIQWRPYLDASSKAYLAPVVALAVLERYTLAPIQLQAGSVRSVKGPGGQSVMVAAGELRSQQPTLTQHAQSVNNEGLLIEATFQLRTVLRRPAKSAADLQPGRLLSLSYKVSASLATTSELVMALANQQQQQPEQANQTTATKQQQQQQPAWPRLAPARPVSARCALELTEAELTKKGGDLFKVGRDYVLFVEPAASVPSMRKPYPAAASTSKQQQQQVASLPHEQRWLPFASHEPVSNQTSRSVNRVLCKNCGEY